MQNAKQSNRLGYKQSLLATKRLAACRPVAARNSRHIVAISIVQGVILIRPVVSLIDPIRSRNPARASCVVWSGLSQRPLRMTDVTSYACLSLCVADVTRVALSIGKTLQLRRRHRRQTRATILTIISRSDTPECLASSAGSDITR